MAYTAVEQDLLSLLQKEQSRNQTPTTAAVPQGPLPDLDPSMLLSPSAQRELSAARGHTFLPPTTSSAAPEVEMTTGWDLQMGDLDPAPVQATTTDDSLGSIFMAQALREIGPDAAFQADLTSRMSSEIDFDTSGMEQHAAPNERVRFQVGRENPRQIPFQARQIASDGEVVRRLTGGRFEPVQRPVVAPERPVRSPEPVRASQPEPNAQSRIDRLLGPSVVD